MDADIWPVEVAQVGGEAGGADGIWGGGPVSSAVLVL